MTENAKLENYLDSWFIAKTVEPDLMLYELFRQAVLPHLKVIAASDPDFVLTTYHHEFKIIRDWLAIWMRNDELQLENAKESPANSSRLDMFACLSDVFETAVREIKEITGILRHRYISYQDAADIDTIMELASGSSIVRIKTANGARREGAFMQNCMVHGEYNRTILEPCRYLYSLRDARNKPHVTMDVMGKLIMQCKGKQDAPVVPKHFPDIRAFCHFKKLDLSSEKSQVGMIFQGGTYHSIYDLPEGAYFSGDLDLRNVTLPVVFPEGSKIEKELIINGAGPAIDYSRCNVKTVRSQHFDKLKRLHREGGAAEILIDKESGEAREQNWYRHGRPIPFPSCTAKAARARARNPSLA